jgi:hypothetical protein
MDFGHSDFSNSGIGLIRLKSNQTSVQFGLSIVGLQGFRLRAYGFQSVNQMKTFRILKLQTIWIQIKNLNKGSESCTQGRCWRSARAATCRSLKTTWGGPGRPNLELLQTVQCRHAITGMILARWWRHWWRPHRPRWGSDFFYPDELPWGSALSSRMAPIHFQLPFIVQYIQR